MSQLDPYDQSHSGINLMEERDVIETDYRWFRYSKGALPLLLFMLLCFVTLLLLTIWVGGLTIRRIKPGIPRDLEFRVDADSDDEAGLPKVIRNMRIATAILAIVPVILVALIYYANPRPKLFRTLMLVMAVILVVAFIMGVITFILDVGKTDRAQRCRTQVGTTGSSRQQVCESREPFAIAATALDAVVAFFALAAAVTILLWSKKGTFRPNRAGFFNQARDNALDDPAFVEENALKQVIPGQSTVHKTLVFLILLALLVSAALLLIFTILLHEFRERVVGAQFDPISRQSQSGWPKENTQLRLAATVVGSTLVLLSFAPYPNRVYAYLLAFGFLVVAILFFVAFGLDVKDLDNARELPCPVNIACIYHRYNTIVFFDIFCGLLVVIYLAYEFIGKRKKSTVSARRYDGDLDSEFFAFGSGIHHPLTTPQAEPYHAPYSTKGVDDVPPAPAGGRLRPLLGVEVIEVEHPHTGELNVTVMSVTPGGAAEEAGLRVGDHIIRWDEIPITCKADFAQAVNSSSIGSSVLLQVIRQIPSPLANSPATTSAPEYCRLTIRGVPA